MVLVLVSFVGLSKGLLRDMKEWVQKIVDMALEGILFAIFYVYISRRSLGKLECSFWSALIFFWSALTFFSVS